jgi:hypothetical protein
VPLSLQLAAGLVPLVRPPHAAVAKITNAKGDHQRRFTANGSNTHAVFHRTGLKARAHR